MNTEKRQLSLEEKVELHKQFYLTSSKKILSNLVKAYERLVHKVTHQVRYQCSESHQDLFQWGNLGLVKALRRFDPNRGQAFSSFAVPYIKGEMLHYLRDHASTVRLPRRWHELYSQLRAIEKRQGGMRHDVQASLLGITSEMLTQIKLGCQVTRGAIKELPEHIIASEQVGKFSYEIGDTHIKDAVNNLQPYFEKLPSMQRQIVTSICLKNLTSEVVAKKFNLTSSELSQEFDRILTCLASMSLSSSAS